VTFLPISFTAAVNSRLAAARYEDVRSFVDKLLRGRETNAAVTTGNECDLSIELAHIVRLTVDVPGRIP
jgi:hypothetical protein